MMVGAFFQCSRRVPIFRLCRRSVASRGSVPWVPKEPNFSDGPSTTFAAARKRETLLSSRGNRPKLKTHEAERVSTEIFKLVAATTASEEQAQTRDAFVQEFRRRVEPEFPGSRLVPFGSAETGVWMADSDLDLSLELPYAVDRVEAKKALKRVGIVIHQLTGDRAEPRYRARIPIIRWEPEGPDVPCCDISINNSLAVANSKLVSAYLSADTRLKPLIVTLKAWARARDINERFKGTLSSFSITLMAISLLQRRHQLPCLQQLGILRSAHPKVVMSLDCSFCDDQVAIAQAISELRGRDAPDLPGRDDSVGTLLYAFFRYYGTEYRGGIVSINRTQIRSETDRDTDAQDLVSPDSRFFFVDNPFQPGLDVANVEPGQYARIRDEMKRACRILGQGRPLADICTLRVSTHEPSAETSSDDEDDNLDFGSHEDAVAEPTWMSKKSHRKRSSGL